MFLLLMFFIITKLLAPLITVTESLKEISEGDGDLTKTLTIKNDDEIGDLSKAFNTFSEGQRSLIEGTMNKANDLKSYC